MKHSLTYIAGIILVSLAPLHAAKQPNVLLIIADDQGWAEIGYNNPDYVYTPNLDRLAATEAKLKNHYVMPQCTPSRVELFTGRYPGRFGTAPLVATAEKCFLERFQKYCGGGAAFTPLQNRLANPQ